MADKPIKVLLIEDNPGDSRLIKEALKGASIIYFDIRDADSLIKADALVNEQNFDAVLLDLFLPDSTGLETFYRFSSKVPETPIIILSVLDDEESAIAAVKAGAQDYFVKGKFDINLLVTSVRYAIERKKIENLRNEFLKMASHEFRTPLAIIKESINLILDKISGDINAKQEKVLTIARDNIDRLSRFVSDLLDISRMETQKVQLRRESVTLKELIRQVVLLFEDKIRSKGLEFITNIPQQEITLYIDIDKIIHVFNNLLSNAIKFTTEGNIKIAVEDRGDNIECSVSDTGIGITKDKLNNIFTKYTQLSDNWGTPDKGTGLGLCIVKWLIELHKGKIWAESQPGKGSVFHFSLPKYSFQLIAEEAINGFIKRALENKTEFSVILILVKDYANLNLEDKVERIKHVLREIEAILKEGLVRKDDVVIRGEDKILVILDYCNKENVLKILNRIEPIINNYLNENDPSGAIKLNYSRTSFPAEAQTYQGLMDNL